MVFLSNRNLIQSEAVLRAGHVPPVQKQQLSGTAPRKRQNGKAASAAVAEQVPANGSHQSEAAIKAERDLFDHTQLPCGYHVAIVAGLALIRAPPDLQETTLNMSLFLCAPDSWQPRTGAPHVMAVTRRRALTSSAMSWPVSPCIVVQVQLQQCCNVQVSDMAPMFVFIRTQAISCARWSSTSAAVLRGRFAARLPQGLGWGRRARRVAGALRSWSAWAAAGCRCSSRAVAAWRWTRSSWTRSWSTSRAATSGFVTAKR